MTKNKKIKKFTWLDLGKAVFYLLEENKKRYIFWNTVRLITYFYVIIAPLILGLTVDFFTDYKRGDSLGKFYVYVLILAGGVLILSVIRSISKKNLIYIRNATYYKIRVKGFRKLVKLSLEEQREESVGAKAQKIQNGMVSFRAFGVILENKIFEAVITLVGIFIVFIFLNPVYILFFMTYYIIFLVLLWMYYDKIQICNYKYNISKEDASGVYMEGLNNILSLKAANAENSFKKYIARKEKISQKIGNNEGRTAINQWISFYFLSATASGVFLFLIGRDVAMGVGTIGSVVITFGYLERLISSSASIVSTYQEFIESKNGIARMMPIFWSKQTEYQGRENFPQRWRSIKMKGVSFTYKKEEQDKFHKGIKKVNFIIEKNSKIGLAGKTGSGKSTLAKLLVGLYRISSGEYLIENKDFYRINNKKLLENISIVLQESEMFNLSLKDNITLMHKFDKKLFRKAVSIAQLNDVIKGLPRGINTLIGEKGYHLSGGERQRIGIARAIYRNAQIIIFDEATSSLDTKTEMAIQRALEKQMRKKTLIFIAHRVATLKNVDKIYVFKNGKIIESGNYKELTNNRHTEFYKLFKGVKSVSLNE